MILQRTSNAPADSGLPCNAPGFRDVGGIRTSTGGVLRRGRLYRSGDLSQLDEADLQKLRALGIGLVCDLRSAHERMLFPTRWPDAPAPEWLRADIATDVRGGHETLCALLAAGTGGARQMMIETYRMLPRATAPVIAALIRRLARDDTTVLVHCTAGKDRTGFVCASLLLALGVSEDAVREDYLRYNALIDLDRMADRSAALLKHLLDQSPPRPVLDLVNRVAIEYLDTALQELRTRYGSFDAYLRAIDISEHDLERFRIRLLDSP